MERLNIARFICNALKTPVTIEDNSFELGLFGAFELDKESTLAGESNSSQDTNFVNRIFNTIRGEGDWIKTDIRHLNLFKERYQNLTSLKKRLYSVATLTPFSCDGLYYVPRLDIGRFILENPSCIDILSLKSILLSDTLFLAARQV